MKMKQIEIRQTVGLLLEAAIKVVSLDPAVAANLENLPDEEVASLLSLLDDAREAVEERVLDAAYGLNRHGGDYRSWQDEKRELLNGMHEAEAEARRRAEEVESGELVFLLLTAPLGGEPEEEED